MARSSTSGVAVLGLTASLLLAACASQQSPATSATPASPPVATLSGKPAMSLGEALDPASGFHTNAASPASPPVAAVTPNAPASPSAVLSPAGATQAPGIAATTATPHPGVVLMQSDTASPAALVPPAPTPVTKPAPPRNRDPWEETNRSVFRFNEKVDRAVLKPVAEGYRDALGPWPRNRIHDFLLNLNEPVILANNILQLRIEDALSTIMRFYINSTFGLLGFFDFAGDHNLPHQQRDFGQTLAGWGVPDGPYVVLPIAGPNTVRDAVGDAVDGFFNPIGWFLPLGANVGRTVVSGVDLRERNLDTLDALQSDSIDFYARLRSMWLQNRDAQLGRTGVSATGAGDKLDILDDPGS